MRPIQLHPSVLRLALAFSLSLALLLPAVSDARQKLPPGTNGLEHCILQDDGDGDSDGGLTSGTNRCCYEDEVAPDEYLTMCVQCDSDWKNCTEEPGTPRIRLNTKPGKATSGSVSEPRGKPKMKIKLPARGQIAE